MIETLSITYYIKLEDDPSKSDSALLSRCWSFWAGAYPPGVGAHLWRLGSRGLRTGTIAGG